MALPATATKSKLSRKFYRKVVFFLVAGVSKYCCKLVVFLPRSVLQHIRHLQKSWCRFVQILLQKLMWFLLHANSFHKQLRSPEAGFNKASIVLIKKVQTFYFLLLLNWRWQEYVSPEDRVHPPTQRRAEILIRRARVSRFLSSSGNLASL